MQAGAIVVAILINANPAGAAGSAVSQAETTLMSQRAETFVWNGFKTIWEERQRRGMADSLRDTLRTGMIGVEFTPLTTTLGNEGAKELSTQPGWAGWIVRQLALKGVKPGDRVAFSMTGSFPGLNLALLAALQAYGLEARGVSSVGSSSWGANEIGLSWPEMERILRDDGVLSIGSGAVTLGGSGDRGLEWGDDAKLLALDAVRRSGLPFLKPLRLRDAISKRLLFYGAPRQYACFINVGGGQATLGGGAKIRFARGGWFTESLGVPGDPEGVMDSFLAAGVPCLNLLYLEDLNRREGILTR